MTIYARCKDGVLTVHENANGKIRILDTDAMVGIPEFDWMEVAYYHHDIKTGKVELELKGDAPVD